MWPPTQPDEFDCCNSGCNPCILDVYEEQLKEYLKHSEEVKEQAKNCLSPTSYAIFKLVDVRKHSKDCNWYTFEYVRPQKPPDSLENESNQVVRYEPGQHLLLKADIHGETFQKAYTPLFVEHQPQNQFTVIVKLYNNGRMSRFFRNLKIGDESLWRGPYGDFKVNYKEKHILFIAQGTGIAPLYSIICDILNNEECYTFLRLFFCCHHENVVLREELYKQTQYWNFKYELFVSGTDRDNFKEKYNETVNFSRLGVQNIEQYLNQASGGAKVYICGAESFCDNVKNMLTQCGVVDSDIVVF